jgi:hypothetical protein
MHKFFATILRTNHINELKIGSKEETNIVCHERIRALDIFTG